MERNGESPMKIVWQTPLLRRIVLIVMLIAIILPAYDLLRVYPSFESLLTTTIEKEARRTGRHLLHMLQEGGHTQEAFTNELFNEVDWNYLRTNAEDYGLWKVRVFSAEGAILFSTTPGEIGDVNNSAYFFDIVAKGRNYSKLERKQQESMEGEVLPVDVVEVYVPAMQGTTFLGAIEVYYDVTDVRGMLTAQLLKSGLIFISLVAAFVLLILLLVLRTAAQGRNLARTERHLSAQEKIFRDVIDTAQEGIMVTDAGQRIIIVNPAFEELTGYAAQEVIGRTPSILGSGRQDAEFYKRMWSSLGEEKRWRGEVWNRRKDGSVYPELLSISAIENEVDGVTHYVGIFTDITQQKASEHHLQKMAYHDPLTMLPNRLLFMDRLNHALLESVRPGNTVALMFIDLDGFKQVNDAAGHETGDLLLQEVAERLQHAVRREDTVARIGGDEFTIILRNEGPGVVLERIANNVIAAINEPVVVGNQIFHVGASIGVACYPSDAKDADSIVNMADEAMYQAKQSGKNCVAFYAAEFDRERA